MRFRSFEPLTVFDELNEWRDEKINRLATLGDLCKFLGHNLVLFLNLFLLVLSKSVLLVASHPIKFASEVDSYIGLSDLL